METKKCFKCLKKKELKYFYKHPKMPDGHVGKCKECNKKDVSLNYSKKKKYYQKYNKIRNSLPENKEKRLIYQKRRRLKFPGKYRAVQKVSNAVRDGRLIKKPCEVCGDIKSQAHHNDYRKWMDVQWLCFKHHRGIHGQTII